MAYILEKIGNTYNLPKKYFTCDAKSDLDGISLVDVPIGSEAYCILEEESYILDSNKQWHKKKIGEDLTGQAQADLSQTDSTQADYVKGIIRQESLPEGYPYKEIETILDGTFEFVDRNGIYMHEITDENFDIVDNESYAVIWDGTTYQCVATAYRGSLLLGNLAIAGAEADTGEPFLFADGMIAANNTAATHTITVRGEVAYPIASEFLPEGYPYKKKTKILPETMVQIETANEAVNNPFIVNFMAGSLYKVIWDGIAYEVIAANIKGATAIGNAALANMGDDTGEPFIIASADNRTILFAETAGSHTISIISEAIHPIATEFLPDKIVNKQDKLTFDSTPTTNSTNPVTSGGVKNALDKKMSIVIINARMPSYARWFSVIYGNGKFVAVAYNSNQTAYSEDGINWTLTTIPSSANWYSVTYGNGKFVAVANGSNQTTYSEDGVNWTTSTMPSSANWHSVTYGNGKFVAVANNSDQAAYSEDGINWTLATTIPIKANWHSVTYGNGKFVAVAQNSDKATYSEDGITWTKTTMPSHAMWESVTYGNGKFVAVVLNSDKLAYSEDGITWTETTMASSIPYTSVAYGNGKFVAVAGNSDTAAYSEDGVNWIASTLPISRQWRSITYGKGKFVAVADNQIDTVFSYDGITWKTTFEYLSQNNSNITESVRSVIGIPSYSTANNGQFLRVSDGIPTWTEFLPILTSPNGTKYKLTVSDDGTLSAVAVS